MMRIFMKTWVKMILLLLLPVLLFSAGCGSPAARQEELKSKLQAYGEEKIVISGLEEQDFEISVAELMELDTVTKSAVSNRANGEQVKVKVTGPLLNTFLKKYEKTQQDFSLIRFSAKDHYSIAASSEILDNRDIILAFMNQGEPLGQEDQPVRVVIPGERAMYWVRMLKRIDFVTGETAERCTKIVFLDTAVRNLPQENYQYYESLDQVIKTRDLIEKYADIDDDRVKSVFMVAGDKLEKNETKANFLSGYIKITGKDIPRFLSPDLPQGMHVRDLLSVHYGTTAFFSLAQARKVLSSSPEAKQNRGIAFTDIVRQVGAVDAERCRFTSADGTRVEFALREIADAYLDQDSKGVVNFNSGPPGNKIVQDLISIELIK